MPALVPVLSKTDIEQKIIETASKISADYEGKELVLIGVLKGAFIFLADLVRSLVIPAEIDFIGVSSYGNTTSSSGSIQITKDLQNDLQGKHVLLVEDIVDSGLTLQHLVAYMRSKRAASVKICTLIDKAERRQVNLAVDYACFEVPEGFLVGYGLDYAEAHRGLPAIYHLKF